MSFLFCRLFKRPKPHSASDLTSQGKHGGNPNKLHRSATAHVEVTRSSASTSDSDDEADDIVLTGPSSAPESLTYRRTVFGDAFVENPLINRRAGGELQRVRTAGAQPVPQHEHYTSRQSMSSSADGTSMDDRLRQQYARIKRVHTGRMAVIMHGTDRQTKRPVVIKAYSKTGMTASKQQRLAQEQAALKVVGGCTGIIKLLNVLDDVLHTYLVLENVPGYTLIELMANNGGRLAETRCVVEVVIPLLRALAALHAAGVVHRDIRPEHVMCAYGTIKLVDFSWSALSAQQCLNDRVGQLEYMAPEVLNKPSAEEVFHKVLLEGMSESELPQYNEKADVWSAGVVIYEALTGMQPFLAESQSEMQEMHSDLTKRVESDGFPTRLQQACLSPLARQFLAAALQPDPAKRASAQELLAHPLVVKHMNSQQGQWLLPQSLQPLGARCASSPGAGHPAPESSSAGGEGRSSGSLIDSHLLDPGKVPLVECLLASHTVDVSVR